MISEVVMPQMGADMTEGTLLRWIKHEGDTIERGEIIAEIETDKANVEIEAFEGGVFRKTLAEEGDVIPVGGVIAVIGDASDDISKYANGSAQTQAMPAQAPAAAARSQPSSPQPAAPAESPSGKTREAPAVTRSEQQAAQETPLAERPQVPAPPPDTHRPGPEAPSDGAPPARMRVSPVARRIAEDNDIDVRTLRGSGPDGRIIRRDVEAAMREGAGRGATQAPAQQRAPGPAASASARADGARSQPARSSPAPAAGPIEQSKMRQAIARRMSQSKREAPHYYLLARIDMTEAATFRAHLNEALGGETRVSVNDLIVRACALALRAFPDLNVTYTGDEMRRHAEQNVCIAIALDDGLIAPAIVGAGEMTLAEIAAASADLAERAKGGRMRPEELNDGTFTVTNLGAYGVETLVGIIQPPQTAILGVGAAADAAVAREGAVVVRKMMEVALSADHRVTDGAYGARFLAEVKRLLERPLLLVL
jgi:pyruvate dehydrogenase E2 component (dihydrolipoamide acetyltransferase)